MTDSATEFELFQVDTELLESPVLASRNASKPKSPLEDIKAPQTTQELFDELEVESSQSQTEVPQVQPIQQIHAENQTSPDQAARVLKLSRKFNRPLTMVEDNLPFFEQKEKNEQASQLIQHAPILQTRFQNSLFRALAFDDTEALTWWETGFKDIGEGFQAGLDSRELGLLGHKSLMGDANDVDLGRIQELEEKLGAIPEHGFLGSSAEIVGQIAPGVPKIIERGFEGAVFGAETALIAGQFGPQIATPEEIVTVPGAAILGGTTAALTEVFIQANILEAGHQFLELQKIGIEEENAKLISRGVGLINGVLEIIGATAVTAPFAKAAKRKILDAFRVEMVKSLSKPTTGKAIRNAITSYVTVLGTEVGTEFAQEVVSVLAEDLAREIDPTEMEAKLATEEGRAEIAQRLESILIKVSKGMALLAVPGAGVQFHSDFRNAQQAKQTEKAMLDLGENAKNSKLRERLPEEFQAYVEEATKDGPVQDVYIEAKEFVEYFQSKGIDPKEVAQELPSIKEKFDEAVTINGDLVIPLSEYATKIAGGEHGPELARHSRFRPDDMSPVEADEWRSTQGEKFREEADRILSENENNQAFQESADRVQEDISKQIQATGKFTKDVADKYGELHGAFAITMAPKLEMQPHEVYEQFGLQVTGKVTPGQGGRTLDQVVPEIIESPEFKEFFGDSKVVDPEGKPMVVFHGTSVLLRDPKTLKFSKEFEGFKTDANSQFGAHFGTEEQANTRVSDSRIVQGGSEPNSRVIPVFISIQNPLRVDDALDFADPELVREKLLDTGEFTEDALNVESIQEIRDVVESKGFDGIVYDNKREGEGDSYIAFNPGQIKSIFNQGTFDSNDPNILNQEKRGAFQFPSDDSTGPSLISLFEKADLSTFLHESGHFFFETYRHIGNQSAAPESIRKDMGALLKFVGVKDIETWNGMSFEERRDGHEKVARAFEAFLFEGKSPSVELRPLFTRFRAWLVHVYKKLIGLDVVLDDEVREVFDRMLASEDKIAEAKHTRLYRPVFENQEQSGLTSEEWTTYQKAVEDSNEEAIAELERKSLGNMKWLSRAKNKLIREKQKEAKAQRFQVEQEVREEISQEPVYRARGFLRRPIGREKEKKKKTDRTIIDPESDSLFAAISKMGGLDRAEVINQWGVDPKERFKSGVFGKTVVKKDGKSIDEIAERLAEFGYLPVDQNGKVDINQLEELFGEESRGEKQFSDRRPVVDDEEGFLQFEREAGTTIVPDDIPPGKLSIPALEEKYGTEETALWKQLPQGRFGLVAEEGHSPDLVAEVFGFTSGDELVTSLVESPSLVDAVRGRADTIMLERFGDLIEQDQIDNAVNEALHNEARTRFLGIELRALSKRAGGGNVLARAAKDFAQENIGKLRVRDIRPAQYESAAIRAGKKSEQAIIRGNTFEAVNQKRAQVLNHHLTREARLAREKADQYLRYLRKFSRKGTRKNIDPEYVIQIDRLLEQYDLRSGVPRAVNAPQQQETVPLDQFVAEKSELGLAPVVHQSVRREGDVRPYKEIPFEELQGLRDTIKSIEHTGRSIRTLLLAERKRKLEEAVGEAVASIQENSPGEIEQPLEPRLQREQKKRLIASYFASNRKFSSLIRTMDGHKDGGVVWDLLVRPLNERSDFEAVEREKATRRLMEIFSVHKSGSDLKTKKFFPAIGQSLSKEGQLAIALNMGNEINISRIQQGYDWSQKQINQVLSNLDKTDWDFVQSVWDFINEFWPDIEAKENRVTGFAPEKVEATPIKTPFGEYRGGYYPIKYENLLEEKAHSQLIEDEVKQLISGAYTNASTKRGHLQQRVEEVNRKVRLDFGVAFEHVNQVIRDLAFHEYLIDANRIMRHKDFQAAVIGHHGQVVYREMQDMVRDIAVGDIPAQTAFEKILSRLRAGVSISAMAWNLNTALLQFTGITQSMVRVGPKWVAKGFSRWFRNSESMQETVGWIHDNSDFMRLRAKTINREINEIRNKLDAKVPSVFKESFFSLIVKAQSLVDIPTWLGAYEKAMDSGVVESKAFAIADQAVLDSQGGGQIKDLSRLQRGGQLQKLLTPFMSYFNITYNLTVESLQEAKNQGLRNPKVVGKLAVDMALLYTIPILFTFFLREAFFNGECDSGTDLGCVAKSIAAEHISYGVGGLVGFRELGGAFSGYDYRGPSGLKFFVEATRLGQQTVRSVKEGEPTKGFFRALNQTGGIVFHYPATQMQKTAEGIMAYAEGKTNNPAAIGLGVPREDR